MVSFQLRGQLTSILALWRAISLFLDEKPTTDSTNRQVTPSCEYNQRVVLQSVLETNDRYTVVKFLSSNKYVAASCNNVIAWSGSCNLDLAFPVVGSKTIAVTNLHLF